MLPSVLVTGGATGVTSGVAAGVYGNNITIPIVTVDAFGRVTSVANTPAAVATVPQAMRVSEL
mgnify:CR=1 FL=1